MATDVSLVETQNNLLVDGTYSFCVRISDISEFGGILGHIHYDQSVFRFNSAETTQTMLDENYAEDAARLTRVIEGDQGWIDDDGVDDGVNTSEPGELRFVALTDWKTTDIFTFKFNWTGKLRGSPRFTLDKLDMCTWEEAWSDISAINNLTVDISDINAINVKGAAIKSINPQDELCFAAQVDSNVVLDASQVGFAMLPTRYLSNSDLITIDGIYSGEKPKVVYADYNSLLNSSNQPVNYLRASIKSDFDDNHASLRYSARSFIKFKDGSIIYSHNTDASKHIVNGQVSRSHAELINNNN